LGFLYAIPCCQLCKRNFFLFPREWKLEGKF
jgi:hypothetical protein